ncbi:MAG: tetratricopeptide repeat protein, partial [Crocosphaera sp.]
GKDKDGKRLTYERIASQVNVQKKTIERFIREGKPVDRDIAYDTCQALELEITEVVDPDEWNYHQLSKPPNTTTAVIDTTLPPIDKWQGRKEEIKELETALDNDDIRLIGITAAGGYGKTALAVKVTEKLEVFWVNFNQPYSLAQFGRWLLEKLNQLYDEKWDEETLILQLIQGLIDKPCLLVLNNLETVLTAENDSVYYRFLRNWLGKGSNSKVLLTSREQPQFSTNLQKRCHWEGLKGLKPEDAISLVKDYELTGTEEELAKFVNKMARHPLLINLMCSLMIDEFGEGVCVTESKNLGLDMFDVEGFHRETDTCVREVVTASLARLSDKLREVLKRLSVLRENFALELAQGVAAEVTDKELRYLARLSLLQEFPPEPQNKKRRRFQFLPLISMVVQQQAETEILRSAHQSALDYYQDHLPAPPWESLEDVTAYLEAFYHAGELGNWQLAYDILNDERGGEGKDKSVDQFLDFQGFNQNRAELYEEVIAGSQREQDCCRKSFGRLGNCYYFLGYYEKAITLYKQHHNLSKKVSDQQGILNSLGGLGNCYWCLGDYEKAITHHHRCYKLSKEIGDQQGLGMALGGLGNCYCVLWQFEKAVDYHQESMKIQKEIGNRQGEAISLGNLGGCYRLLEKYKKAITSHQKSLEIHKEISDRQGEANCLEHLGNCYYSLEQYKEAINHYQQSLEIKKEIGDQKGRAISLHNIGGTFIELDNYSEAESKIKESLAISQEINFQDLTTHNLKFLAEIAYKTDRPELALTRCQEALELGKELGIPLVKDCEELLAEIQDTLS